MVGWDMGDIDRTETRSTWASTNGNSVVAIALQAWDFWPCLPRYPKLENYPIFFLVFGS